LNAGSKLAASQAERSIESWRRITENWASNNERATFADNRHCNRLAHRQATRFADELAERKSMPAQAS
jgi:hypothetical protein